VVASSSAAGNGNFVVIEHNGTYTTKYLHLDKRSVKQGESVKQGQVIGTVGSTGYATGPHLHYEFLINGTHTNPRTVALKWRNLSNRRRPCSPSLPASAPPSSRTSINPSQWLTRIATLG